MVRVKVCGITNLKDALAVVEFGADALGFVFYSKSPRAVTQETAREIISSLPPFITTVGVFVNEKRKKIEEIVYHTGLDAIQLHGTESPDDCRFSRKVIKAFRIKELSDLEPLNRYKTASALLLDTYSPYSIGGTGQVFNWEIAVEAKQFGKIILAGGLTPDNVEEAVKLVRPYGIDVATGVEGNEKGKKDHHKLRSFIEKALNASHKHA